MGVANHHFNEKRGMICKVVKKCGTMCGKVAMYHAGQQGFCFDHKEEATYATIQLKRKHQSKSGTEDFFRKKQSQKTFD